MMMQDHGVGPELGGDILHQLVGLLLLLENCGRGVVLLQGG